MSDENLSRLEAHERFMHHAKLWGSIGASVFVAAFAVSAYLGHFQTKDEAKVQAAEVDHRAEQQRTDIEEHARHLAGHDAVLGAEMESLRRIDSRLERVDLQLYEIVTATGARRVVPAPKK